MKLSQSWPSAVVTHMHAIKGADMPTCGDKTFAHTRTHLSFQTALGKGVKGRERHRDREGSAKGKGREVWPLFHGHAAADRGGIGYQSLTPNTFTADNMINEPGAALQGLFLDPLDPLPTAQLPLALPPPSH